MRSCLKTNKQQNNNKTPTNSKAKAQNVTANQYANQYNNHIPTHQAVLAKIILKLLSMFFPSLYPRSLFQVESTLRFINKVPLSSTSIMKLCTKTGHRVTSGVLSHPTLTGFVNRLDPTSAGWLCLPPQSMHYHVHPAVAGIWCFMLTQQMFYQQNHL